MSKKKKTEKEGKVLKKVSENAKQEKFIELGKLIEMNKARKVCYAADGNTGYFYYELMD